MSEENNRRSDRWHIGKEIPLAVVIAFVLQTAGIIWWVATFSADFRNLTVQVAGLAGRQFTLKDGSALIESSKSRDLEQDRRIIEIEARVRDLEQRRK